MTKSIWSTQEEAEHLDARFVGINKAEFARKHNLPGGASMLNQHTKGHRPMNMDAALIYMKAFGVSLGEISPRLAREMSAKLRLLDESKQEAVAEPAEPPTAPGLTFEENPALSLAVEFQRVPAQTADGRTRDQLYDWLVAQIDAWPNVDPRKFGRAAQASSSPSPGHRKQREKVRAPRAADNAS